jgi:5,10-methylenetetrahydrofolate reductase
MRAFEWPKRLTHHELTASRYRLPSKSTSQAPSPRAIGTMRQRLVHLHLRARMPHRRATAARASQLAQFASEAAKVEVEAALAVGGDAVRDVERPSHVSAARNTLPAP